MANAPNMSTTGNKSLRPDIQSSGIGLSFYQTFQIVEITLAIPLCSLKKDRLD
jgi:hypothetical protein